MLCAFIFERRVGSKANVLKHDEATNMLASEKEPYIRKTLNRLTRGRATIVITYHMSTVIDADKIVVSKGSVVSEQNTILA